MKRIFYLFSGLSCILLSPFFMQSCVDKDYDLDDVNKEAQFNLPPVPYGDFKPIILKELVPLPVIPPIEGLPDIGVKIAYDYVFEDLFNKDFIDYFFYEGNNVALNGVVDVVVLKPNSSATLSLGMTFKILDEENGEIQEIKFPNQPIFNNGKAQPFEIKIESQYMKYFEARNAKHLKVYLVLESSSLTNIDAENAYVEFKDIVIKSDALQFDF